MKTLARLFLISGILLFAVAIYHIVLRENPQRLSFDSYTYAQAQQSIKNASDSAQLKDNRQGPIRVIAPAMGIDTPIYPASVTKDQWQTTKAGASYLASSPLPGEKGNSVLYGHNWENIFGGLTSAKPGQKITVVYGDGTKKAFTVRYISEVTPNTSSILAPSDDTRLTLYTCSGFLDSKRFVVVAVLKG